MVVCAALPVLVPIVQLQWTLSVLCFFSREDFFGEDTDADDRDRDPPSVLQITCSDGDFDLRPDTKAHQVAHHTTTNELAIWKKESEQTSATKTTPTDRKCEGRRPILIFLFSF